MKKMFLNFLIAAIMTVTVSCNLLDESGLNNGGTLPTYAVTFDSQGAEMAANPGVKMVKRPALTVVTLPTTPVKAGNTFAGWFTEVNGAGTEFTATTAVDADITVYAKWVNSIVVFTVTFWTDNGSSIDNQTIENGGLANIPLPPAKTGFAFSGWYKDAGFKTLWNFTTDTVTADTTIYVKWVAGTPKNITFDKNHAEATGTMTAVGGAEGVTVTLSGCTFTRAGYTFKGWALTASGESAFNDKASLVIGATDMILYALWVDSSIQYVINFNKNDVDATGSMAGITGVNGVPVLLPACGFIKTGMVFKGWATSADGAAEYADKASVTINGANITLYAKWGIYIPTYRVIYNGNGDGVTGVPADNTLYTNSMNVVVLDKDVMARTGYSFNGWNSKTDGTGTARAVDSNFMMGNADVVLYAQWSATSYMITYHLDGGTNHGDNPTSFTAATVLTLQSPSKEYHDFTGWYEDIAYSIPVTGIAKATTGNKNFYAKWTVKSFTVSFNKNHADATGLMTALTVNYGAKVTLPACTMSRTDYVFTGWATSTAGAVVYADGTELTMGNANVVLHAVWEIPINAVAKSEMVAIPGGTFIQGEGTNSYFQHTISDFSLGKYEITYELWYTVYHWAIDNGYYFQNPGREGNDGMIGAVPTAAKYEPVTTVSWRDAIVWCNAYSEMTALTPVYSYNSEIIRDSRIENETACDSAVCDWSKDGGYRLPSEGEWEYAARNKGATPYYYASGASDYIHNLVATKDVAWFGDNSNGVTHLVGTKNPNELSIYDMSGNVYEMCYDRTWNYPNGIFIDYEGNIINNPIIRGGSYSMGCDLIDVCCRNDTFFSIISNDLGFRVARSGTRTPKEVTSLAITSSGNTITATWTEPSDADFTGVEIISGYEGLTKTTILEPKGVTSINFTKGMGERFEVTVKTMYTGDRKSSGLFIKHTIPVESVVQAIPYRDMAAIPGGTYQQYNGSSAFQHTITGFQMGRYEITYELWYTVKTWAVSNGYAFANAGKEGDDGVAGAVPTAAKLEPVTGINWRDAIVWCNAYSQMTGGLLGPVDSVYYTDAEFTTPLKVSTNTASINSTAGSEDNPYVKWDANGYRLPTEGEWFFAASERGATPYNYASGATAPTTDVAATGEVAWYSGNSTGHTQTIGQKRANRLGLFDMSGNITEFRWDWSGTWPTANQTDYKGPVSGTMRIAADYDNFYGSLNNQSLGWGAWSYNPYTLFNCVGFRVVRR